MKSKEVLINEILEKMEFLLKRTSVSDLKTTLKEIDDSINRVKRIEKIVESWKEDENN